MLKLFILSKDNIFIRNLNSILDKNKYQIIVPNIESDLLYSYCCNFNPDICIIHKSYVGNNYQVLNQLIGSKKIVVIYFSLTNDYVDYNNPRFYAMKDNAVFAVNEIIDLIIKENNIINKLNNQIDSMKKKEEEERFIKKAKLFLMNKGYTEEEAYKYILKYAMDLRLSKGLAAKKILEG